MPFEVKEHGGISPEKFERPFFLKHFIPYGFVKDFVKDKVVLEIGFGDGYGSFHLSKYAKKVYAIDLFEKNVTLAKEKYKNSNLEYITMDGCDLKFKDRSFDIVISFQTIEHIPRQLHEVFLNEAKRVLVKDGIFVLTTPNLEKLRKKNKPHPKNPHHDMEFTYDTLKRLLHKHFIIVKMHGIDYSARQRFFRKIKSIGFFHYFPDNINPVKKYFKNIREHDFVIRDYDAHMGIDLLGVCRLW